MFECEDLKGRPCSFHLLEGCVIGVGVRSADHNVIDQSSDSEEKKEIQWRSSIIANIGHTRF